MDIIKRISGCNNKEMLDQCEMIKAVATTTVEAKSGRGKAVKVYQVLKHNIPKNVVDRILRSCDYYKELHEKDMERNNQIKFRDYQLDIIRKGTEIITQHGFLYLAMEVRTGKTLTSLGIAERINASNVLFITKKKAISSIEGDYQKFNPPYYLKVINYDSLHLVMHEKNWDLIICDEAHGMGAFPKPSNRAVLVGEVINKYKPKVIFLLLQISKRLGFLIFLL